MDVLATDPSIANMIGNIMLIIFIVAWVLLGVLCMIACLIDSIVKKKWADCFILFVFMWAFVALFLATVPI